MEPGFIGETVLFISGSSRAPTPTSFRVVFSPTIAILFTKYPLFCYKNPTVIVGDGAFDVPFLRIFEDAHGAPLRRMTLSWSRGTSDAHVQILIYRVVSLCRFRGTFKESPPITPKPFY